MKNSKFFFLLPISVFGILAFQACTDLEVGPTDSVFTPITGETFQGDAEAFLASAYNDMNSVSDQANIYSLTEHVSDEMIPPTRGTDWGDNGVWRTLHAHTWDASHAFVGNSWNQLNERVFRCNQVLGSTNPAPNTLQIAEAKFLRAWYMYQVMDFWGKVPFRKIGEGVDVNPTVLDRSAAFDFVEKDLTEALPDLPVLGPGGDHSKASKAACNALLARLYLNKAVYKAPSTTAALPFDNADMAKVISHCDAVIADGYTLEPDYFNIFQLGSEKEIILTTNNNNGSPQNRVHMTLHYDNNPSGWNGFATLSDFYAKFQDGDQRKGKVLPKDGTPFNGVDFGFLVGTQYKDDGTVVKNSRAGGNDLVFTSEVPLIGANAANGIRVMKYHANSGGYPRYILLRLGDVITMKAEAQLRSGGDALATLNALRAVRAPSLAPLASIDLAGMLDERGRELYWEGQRRMDQVRFGTFANAWQDKTKTDPTRNVFPIPQQALDSNPNLRQNDGY